jgi:hypothetical protein
VTTVPFGAGVIATTAITILIPGVRRLKRRKILSSGSAGKQVKFKGIASRITGFSIPVFGISWNPPEPEAAIARKVLAFLEDRRVLFNPYHREIADQCVQFVLDVRRVLDEGTRPAF